MLLKAGRSSKWIYPLVIYAWAEIQCVTLHASREQGIDTAKKRTVKMDLVAEIYVASA